LTDFGDEEFDLVRVALSAYGIHLFGRVHIRALPETGPAYIHFRAFATGGSNEPATLHSIHTEETEAPGGVTRYRAIFDKEDELQWFNT